jgi:16S rRNA (uracil1498-N3)-methyltransferase
MRLFILPSSYQGEEFLELAGEEYHRIVRVLRKKKGDSGTASDGTGNLYHAPLEEVGSSRCRLRVQRRGPLERPFPEIILFQCLPKGKKMDLIVRQAVELGVTQIVPLVSRYSIPRWEAPDEKVKRLMRIAREAAQQSGSPEVPEIHIPISLEMIPSFWNSESPERLGLFFHQEPLARTSLHEYLSIHRKAIALVIGPEGGLAEEETRFLQSAGFFPAYLGPTVLRTETAPVFGVAAVQIILLERKTWKLQQEP